MSTDQTDPDGIASGDESGEEAPAPTRKREGRVKIDVQEPAVFILRMPRPSTAFAWEVRRYSSIVLARGEGYATEELARAAGERALIVIRTLPQDAS